MKIQEEVDPEDFILEAKQIRFCFTNIKSKLLWITNVAKALYLFDEDTLYIYITISAAYWFRIHKIVGFSVQSVTVQKLFHF